MKLKHPTTRSDKEYRFFKSCIDEKHSVQTHYVKELKKVQVAYEFVHKTKTINATVKKTLEDFEAITHEYTRWNHRCDFVFWAELSEDEFFNQYEGLSK